jgi:hypothetical protein
MEELESVVVHKKSLERLTKKYYICLRAYQNLREEVNKLNQVSWDYEDDSDGELKLIIESILATFPKRLYDFDPWISVKDMLPPVSNWVLAYPTQLMGVSMAWRLEGGKYLSLLNDYWWQPPTHWMPLPEPPEVEGE